MNESAEKDLKKILENIRLMKGEKLNLALLENNSFSFVKLNFFKLDYKFYSEEIDFYENLTVAQVEDLTVTKLKRALNVFALKAEKTFKKKDLKDLLIKYLNEQIAAGLALRVDGAAMAVEEPAEGNDNDDEV